MIKGEDCAAGGNPASPRPSVSHKCVKSESPSWLWSEGAVTTGRQREGVLLALKMEAGRPARHVGVAETLEKAKTQAVAWSFPKERSPANTLPPALGDSLRTSDLQN